MDTLTTVVGDATAPGGPRPYIIAHVCNDIGAWGKGFVLALSRQWPQPESEYRRWYRERAHNDFGLGAVQFVTVEDDLEVANMVAQRGLRRTAAGPPIRYDALGKCLDSLAEHAAARGATVHLPRIGAGLAGGDWDRIRHMIEEALSARSVRGTVYVLD